MPVYEVWLVQNVFKQKSFMWLELYFSNVQGSHIFVYIFINWQGTQSQMASAGQRPEGYHPNLWMHRAGSPQNGWGCHMVKEAGS